MGANIAKPRDSAELCAALGYTFRDKELLKRALSHTSHARESEAASRASRPDAAAVADNEQLEFLGDAVLGLVAAEELLRRFPGHREGELSKLRAHLVSERHLVSFANELSLGDYISLGKGEEKSGGRAKVAILVDALEATLAAIYLDGGIDAVRQIVAQRIITPELSRIAVGTSWRLADYKSALQERLQAEALPQPIYRLIREEGPEHSKIFVVEVKVRCQSRFGRDFEAKAEGTTKKSAEQRAAKQALEYLISSDLTTDAPVR